jgi:hypothetical protein
MNSRNRMLLGVFLGFAMPFHCGGPATDRGRLRF